MSDPGWTAYVIGKLVSDELEGQNPRVEGLRRVAEELLGEIMEEGYDLVSPPTAENDNRACVKAWVIFDTDAGRKRFEGLADVSLLNCDENFAKFPTSTVESRAKGRCFWAALHLKRVIAAEDVDGNNPLKVEGEADDASTSQMSRLSESSLTVMNENAKRHGAPGECEQRTRPAQRSARSCRTSK
jgi:hypothetical protein